MAEAVDEDDNVSTPGVTEAGSPSGPVTPEVPPQAKTTTEAKEAVPQLCVSCRKKPVLKKAYCGHVCWIKSHFRRSVQLVFSWTSPTSCGLVECGLPIGKSELGKHNGYCSEKHLRISMTRCLNCKHRSADKAFCTPECVKELVTSNKTTLLEIPRSHGLFQYLERKFNSTWIPGVNPPKILHVYRIVILQALYDRSTHCRYTEGDADEELRWHGTIRNCKIGNKGNTTICSNFEVCFLCSILVHSFDANKCHYGGLFTSSTAADSSVYARNMKHSGTKALLL